MRTEYQLPGLPLEGFAPVLLGLAVAASTLVFSHELRTRSRPSAWSQYAPAGMVAVGVAALAAGGLITTARIVEHARLQSAIAANRIEIVTGCLSGFAPAAAGTDRPDVLVMGRRIITYGGPHPGPGFARTVAEGGPIRPDSWLRVVLVGDVIVRLDVDPDAPCPTAPAYRA